MHGRPFLPPPPRVAPVRLRAHANDGARSPTGTGDSYSGEARPGTARREGGGGRDRKRDRRWDRNGPENILYPEYNCRKCFRGRFGPGSFPPLGPPSRAVRRPLRRPRRRVSVAETRKAGREEAVLQSLASKQPQKITGRQAFFAQCVDAMKATVGPEQREATAKRVMQRHAAVFRMLPAEVQEEYEARAQAMALERRAALAKEAEAVLAARLERRHQARAQASMAAALSLSSRRLSATDLATMAGIRPRSSLRPRSRFCESKPCRALACPPRSRCAGWRPRQALSRPTPPPQHT